MQNLDDADCKINFDTNTKSDIVCDEKLLDEDIMFLIIMAGIFWYVDVIIEKK